MFADLDPATVLFRLGKRGRLAVMDRLARQGRALLRLRARDSHRERDPASPDTLPASAGRTQRRHRALTVSLSVAVGFLLVLSAGAGARWARDLDVGPWALPAHGEYLWQGSREVDLLTLTLNRSTASGSLADAQLQDTKVRSNDYSLGGAVRGGQVTLHSNADVFGSVQLQAHFQGTNVILLIPESGSSPRSLTFTPSLHAQYNSVVQQFRQTARANAEAAAALTRADQKIDQTAQAFNSAYTKVQNDTANLPNDQYLGDAAQAANQAAAGLLTEENDALRVTDEAPSNPGCSTEAGAVTTDTSSLQGYQGSLSGFEQSLQGDITNTSNDATALQNAQGAYMQAQSGDPAHQDQVPSASQVTGAIQSLQGAQAQARQTMTGYANWVAQDYARAQSLSRQAQTTCG